jgi:hypothetical protein
MDRAEDASKPREGGAMTITIKRVASLAGTAVAASLAVPAAAVADERVCVGAIGPETVDNVRVPEAETCVLAGTVVQGTVKVERAATLQANAVNVIGNVQGEGAANVVVRGSRVGGSVQVKQGGAAETSASRVTGDIQYDLQTRALRVADNFVGGSVQVVANTGGIVIATNTIDGNLQCKENAPPPTGGGNLVHGNAEDQCATLAGGPGAPSPGNGGGQNGGNDDDDVTLRRPVARGAKMVFRGRARQATAGVKVRLQVRRGGRWRSVDDDRTNRRGAYRIAHRFAARKRARTVQVRTLVRPQAGWSSRAVSRVVAVRIAVRSSD